jgi:hypothetical protein
MVHQYKRQEIMNARKVETLTQNRRAEEQRVKGLLRYNSECQRLSNMTVNNSRRASVDSLVDTERQKRRALELKRKEDILKKAEADEAERERQQKSMERGKLEREIQCICDSSEELRELERNIKIAYVNKERAAQHQESLLIKNIENAREQMIEEEMERKRQNLIRIEEEKDKHRRDKLVAQKTVLQGQMREHEVRVFDIAFLMFLLLEHRECPCNSTTVTISNSKIIPNYRYKWRRRRRKPSKIRK